MAKYKQKAMTKKSSGVKLKPYAKVLKKKPKKPYTYKAGDEKPKDMSEEEYEKVRRNSHKLYERVWSKKKNRPIMRIKHSMGRTDIRRPKETKINPLSLGKRKKNK
jgi:hypothetical protein